MPAIAELDPGLNAGVNPSDVTDLRLDELLGERIGFGADAVGGLDGEIYIVNSLNDTGNGTLRDALSDGPRWIIPVVSGTVALASRIDIDAPVTLDGRFAGFGVKGYGLRFLDSPGLIVVNIDFGEQPPADAGSVDALEMVRPVGAWWLHHLGMQNYADELFSVRHAVNEPIRGTVSWCRFRDQNKTILGNRNDGPHQAAHLNITLHHNFMIRCGQRLPRLAYGSYADIFNNAVEEWTTACVQVYDGSRARLRRNWFKAADNKTVIDRGESGVTYAPTSGSNANVLMNGATDCASYNYELIPDPPNGPGSQYWAATEENRGLVRSKAGPMSPSTFGPIAAVN